METLVTYSNFLCFQPDSLAKNENQTFIELLAKESSAISDKNTKVFQLKKVSSKLVATFEFFALWIKNLWKARAVYLTSAVATFSRHLCPVNFNNNNYSSSWEFPELADK